MYLFCRPTVNDIFSVEYWRDFEMWIVNIIGNDTIRQIAQKLLFVFHYNYGRILYRFRNKAIYLSKTPIFHLTYTIT